MQKIKRCPNGTHKNKKTGTCDPIKQTSKRCPKGTRKNKKTGTCEPRMEPKKTTSIHQTRMDIYYPKTRVQKIYTRKPKSPPKIQTKLTQYLKPVII